MTTWLCSTKNQLTVEQTDQDRVSSRIIFLGRTFLLLRQLSLIALKKAGDIRDGVIPEDTDRLCSFLCFQHGILHYDGFFHQVGRKLPITVNGCAHYRRVDDRAIWQSGQGEKLHSDLRIKMQSYFLQIADFLLLLLRNQMHHQPSIQKCFQKLLALLAKLFSHSVPQDKRQYCNDNSSTLDGIWPV